MATSYSPSIVRSGLVLYIDPENERSFPGSPITNYFYLTNPRIDSSYAPYVRTTSGTWPQKHPDAITVYDVNGNNISDYSNTGVADWTNVYHAIWTYDYTLKKPVVTIRNHDAGTWKAKYFFGASMNFSALGMTVGSQYTISWLQWTDDINRAANVGLYTRDNSNVQSFWDGLSANSTTTKNTKVGTWQRVYHTYTVSASRNLSDTSTALYMYGYEYGTGTIKISDVQIELFSTPSNFSYSQTRGATVATGGGTIDLSNNSKNGEIFNNMRQTIYTPKSFVFNGTNNYITIPSQLTSTAPLTGYGNFNGSDTSTFSLEVWIKTTQIAGSASYVAPALIGRDNGDIWANLTLYNGYIYYAHYDGTWLNNLKSNTMVSNNVWHQVVYVNNSNKTGSIYIDGALEVSGSSAFNIARYFSPDNIGRGYSGAYYQGNMGSIRIYDKSLTAAEVRQNYNATKSRYGL